MILSNVLGPGFCPNLIQSKFINILKEYSGCYNGSIENLTWTKQKTGAIQRLCELNTYVSEWTCNFADNVARYEISLGFHLRACD